VAAVPIASQTNKNKIKYNKIKSGTQKIENSGQ
jgi:hypothetical protein